MDRRRWSAALLAATLGALALPAAASAGIAALWHMDETSGATMFDSSGLGNNGTLTSVALGQPGFQVLSYGFNGASSIVKVPSRDSLNPDPAAGSPAVFTVTAHVLFTVVPSAAVGDYDLVRKGLSSTTGGYWKMEIYANSSRTQGQAMCQMKGSLNTTGTFVAGPNLADGRWHTIQCVKRATSVSVVVDGITYTKNVAVGRIANTAQLTVGAKNGGGDWFNGRMDEVGITTG
jgi:concanavalin A-like lectin/glucanase superfamily protein